MSRKRNKRNRAGARRESSEAASNRKSRRGRAAATPAPRRTALVVLGMHRSGTSPLTRLLSLLGADLPSVLMPPAPGDNELGFWEPDEIVKIHDEMLSDARSSWDDVSPFPESWYGSEAAQRFRGEILKILERDFSGSKLFVLKDPRVCRFVPFWLTTLKEFGADPRFVISVRHPLEVAASLQRRDEFLTAKSVLLWLWHLLEAERETRKLKRSFVFYEALLRDWRTVAKRVSKDLGVSWPKDIDEAGSEIDEFLSPTQRHHSRSLEDLTGAEIADWAKQAYQSLLNNWSSPSKLAKSMDGIRQELSVADRAYGPLVSEARLRLSAHKRDAERLANEVNARKNELVEKDRETTGLSEKLEEKHSHIVGVAGELAASVRELAQQDAHIEGLAGELAARDRKLAEKDEHIASLTNELKGRHRELAEKDNQIYGLSGAVKRREEELAERLEDIVSLSVSLSERNHELGEKNEASLRLASQLEVTAHQLKKMERVLQGVLFSRSWRVTAPFRAWAARLRSLRKKEATASPEPAVDARVNDATPLVAGTVRPRAGVRRAEFPRMPTKEGRRRFALYVASRGNYFFGEIRDLLAAGLRTLGFEVSFRTELDGFVEDVEWHVVIAPHEFFYLGAGAALRERPAPANLILFNTEQPTTKWFTLASECFHKAHCIWDIHRDSALSLEDRGFPCNYVPLGYVRESNPFPEVEELPENYHTCFLEPAVRRGAYLNKPLIERPIDVLFLGTITPRRDAFFASAAPILANHRCYLSLPDASRPKIIKAGTTMDTQTAIGLAQRSKIVLNVHRDRENYFEWHRIVMHGIWHKALVLSEECSIAPPLRAGVDFAEAPLHELPRKIAHYLLDPVGRKEAQTIASQGFQTLTTECELTDVLRPLIRKLYASDSQTDDWQTIASHGELASEWLGPPASAPVFPE